MLALALTRNLVRSPLAMQNAVRFARTTAPTSVSMKIIPAGSVERDEDFEQKNLRLKRELSPHLTVYKPQLTSMLSICHRMTGCLLGTYIWSIGISQLLFDHDFSHFVTMLDGLELSATSWKVLKFAFIYPFAFHAGNGIRHLIWDTGKFLKINEVYTTGYVLLGFSVIFAGVLASL